MVENISLSLSHQVRAEVRMHDTQTALQGTEEREEGGLIGLALDKHLANTVSSVAIIMCKSWSATFVSLGKHELQTKSSLPVMRSQVQ